VKQQARGGRACKLLVRWKKEEGGRRKKNKNKKRTEKEGKI